MLTQKTKVFKASHIGFRTHIYLISYHITTPFVLTWDDNVLSGCPKLSLGAVSLHNPTSLPWPDHIHRGDLGSDTVAQGFPGGREVKNPPANAGDAGDTVLIPEWGRSLGGRNGYPFQYSCQENSMDQKSLADWSPWISKSWTQLSKWTCRHVQLFKHSCKEEGDTMCCIRRLGLQSYVYHSMFMWP